MKKVCDFIARWMGVLVLLTAVGALLCPAPLGTIDTWYINPFIGLIMFGMGLTLSAHDFRVVFSRPKDVVMGCLAQFTIMPLMAWLLSLLFSLPKELALGMILVGCCPGGTASNVITFLAKGDLALSVGMTATSTLLAPVLTPLLVWLLAGTMVDVDTIGMLQSIVYVVIAPIIIGLLCQRYLPNLTMLQSIVYVVIAPIIIGLLCQRYLPNLTHRVVPYLPAFSSLMIALVAGIIVSHTSDKLLAGGLLIILVVMLHNLSGLAFGFTIGRLLHLSREKCIAVSIEVGMQNSGLASSLAVLHFAAFPLATIPGAIFSVWHNISGALVAKWYTR